MRRLSYVNVLNGLQHSSSSEDVAKIVDQICVAHDYHKATTDLWLVMGMLQPAGLDSRIGFHGHTHG